MTAYPQVTFVMTCGRRFDMLRATMDSFLRCCQDQDLIAEYLFSADRAPEAELRAMHKAYPFAKIGIGRPGHAANLNGVYGQVKTTWALQWEDDWLTVREGHFIRDALDIALIDSRNRNVVLREWHGVMIKVGELVYCCTATGHAVPENCPSPWKENQETCAFSLNPGIVHVPTIKALGGFNERIDPRRFEAEFGQRYSARGYTRAHVLKQWVDHIGSEHSAYDM